MRQMKDSGVEWIGKIPNDWEVRSVKSAFNRSKLKAQQENPIILSLARDSVKIRDISTNEGQLAESYYDYNPVESGDLLLNPMDLYSGANCNVSKISGVISPAYVNLKAKNEIYSTYFDYYFKTQYWSMAFFAHGLGVSFDNRWTLNNQTLMNYKIPLPTYNEQQKIADYLDKKVALIDNIIEKTKESIEEYKKLKQSIITETVTKGLNPDVKMKDSGIEWIGMIPEHWEIKAHKFLMSKTKEICSEYSGEDILSLTRGGVVIRDLENPSGKMPSTFDGYQIVYPGNLLLCLFDIDVTPRCVGIINNYGLTSPAYSQFVVKEGYSASYYNLLLEMIDDIKAFLHLSKNLRSSLTENDFGAIKTIVPPLQEQIEISLFIESKKKEIEDFIQRKVELVNELESYKKSLIYEVVTGKKEIPTQEVGTLGL